MKSLYIFCQRDSFIRVASMQRTIFFVGCLFWFLAAGVAFSQTATPTATGTSPYSQSSTQVISNAPTATPTGAITPGSGISEDSYITSDGRFVVFESTSVNLILAGAGVHPPGTRQIYVYDRQTKAMDLVSRATFTGSTGDGTIGNGNSFDPVISRDGRYIAFSSDSTNLLAGGADSNGVRDIFVRDRKGKVTFLISRQTGNDGTIGNGDSNTPWISKSGEFAVYASAASNLDTLFPGEEPAGVTDCFLREGTVDSPLRTRRIAFRSENFGEARIHPDEDCRFPTIDDDATYLAFSSESNLLELNDTNDAEDIFVTTVSDFLATKYPVISKLIRVTNSYDRLTAANGISTAPQISGNGRYIVYQSTASNMLSSATNGIQQIFLHDREFGNTILCSGDLGAGLQGNQASADPAISVNGDFLTFGTFATNLGPTSTKSNIMRAKVSKDAEGQPTTCSLLTISIGTGTGSDQDALNGSGAVGLQQVIERVAAPGVTPTPVLIRVPVAAFDSDATNLVTPSRGSTNNDIFISPRCTTTDASTDTDTDGTVDCFDQCWQDKSKVVDDDDDFDGVPNCVDGCPDDSLKDDPGVCGCGTLDIDSDADDTPDCDDQCPSDPLKVEAGDCGCGQVEVEGCGAAPTATPTSPSGTATPTVTPTGTPETAFVPAAATLSKSGRTITVRIPAPTLTGFYAGRVLGYSVILNKKGVGRVASKFIRSRRTTFTVSSTGRYSVRYRIKIRQTGGGTVSTGYSKTARITV